MSIVIRAAALCLLLLGGCATSAGTDASAGSNCDVTVSFGSYAMGIDGELRTRVLQLVREDSGVFSSDETPWGREGESTLCVKTDNAGAADRVYNRIVGLLPRYSDQAPTTVTHRDGRTRAVGPSPQRN